jgi:methyl-accepting chemotaxis protein
MKIRTKILVAPAVAIACLVILGVTAMLTLRFQQTAMADIVENRFANFQFASGQALAIDEVHAGAYRLFTWINNLDDAKAAKATKALTAKADDVAKAFDQQAARTDLSDDERKLLAETQAQFGKYRKVLSQALDLAMADVNTGMAMMQTTDDNFRELRVKLEAMIELEKRVSLERYEAANARYATVTGAIVAALLLGLAASGALSLAMARAIVRPLGRAIGAASEIAQGDLARAIDFSGNDETALLLRSMHDMQQSLKGVVHRIGSGAAEVSGAAQQLSATAGEVAVSSRHQSEAAAATAAAVEEVSVSIALVSDKASQAREVADETVRVADQGLVRVQQSKVDMGRVEDMVEQTARHIGELASRSSQIGSIANVIKDIADQTNLLALNAAIEAARAGEQGRGFAVVADEVRKLAEKTAGATNEIKSMIDAIQTDTKATVTTMSSVSSQVREGVAGIDSLVEPLSKLNTGAHTALSDLGELSAATREQNHATQEIARNVESIASMAESNNEAVAASVGAADNLSRLARELLAAVGHFKT